MSRLVKTVLLPGALQLLMLFVGKLTSVEPKRALFVVFYTSIFLTVIILFA
jgi:hypothetical protein